jgi:hypothetical protein
MKANAVETHYAKDNEILSFITSGEEE